MNLSEYVLFLQSHDIPLNRLAFIPHGSELHPVVLDDNPRIGPALRVGLETRLAQARD